MSNELMNNRARFPGLAGRHVFITGGAAGIGRSLVEHFADQGAKVSFVDVDEVAANRHVNDM